jgi:hypothetical protein
MVLDVISFAFRRPPRDDFVTLISPKNPLVIGSEVQATYLTTTGRTELLDARGYIPQLNCGTASSRDQSSVVAKRHTPSHSPEFCFSLSSVNEYLGLLFPAARPAF